MIEINKESNKIKADKMVKIFDVIVKKFDGIERLTDFFTDLPNRNEVCISLEIIPLKQYTAI